MKMISKVLLTAVAVAALAAPAMAADKLIVRNAGDTADVFKVDDTGMILGAKMGVGTSAPQAPLHLQLPTGTGAVVSAGTALYNNATGFALSSESNSSQADFTVADNTGTTPGYRGTVRGVRARGALASPTVPLTDDQVLSVLGGVYTGSTVWNAADITMKVDGTVAHNTGGATVDSPVRITFSTRPKGWTWYERLTIKSNGNVGINQPSPTSILHVSGLVTYSSNAAAKTAGLTAGAFYTDGVGNVKVVY